VLAHHPGPSANNPVAVLGVGEEASKEIRVAAGSMVDWSRTGVVSLSRALRLMPTR